MAWLFILVLALTDVQPQKWLISITNYRQTIAYIEAQINQNEGIRCDIANIIYRSPNIDNGHEGFMIMNCIPLR